MTVPLTLRLDTREMMDNDLSIPRSQQAITGHSIELAMFYMICRQCGWLKQTFIAASTSVIIVFMPIIYYPLRKLTMAELGEWNQKGATLSDVTAQTEYGVSQEFIIKDIKAGQLEYRDGSVWGNPYLRILRSQLEKYIATELGDGQLRRIKGQAELRKVKKEMTALNKKLNSLQNRKKELEASLRNEEI